MILVPIISVFLSEKISVPVAQLIGTGLAIEMTTRALFQIPIGWLGDRIKKDRDEIFFMGL